MYLLVDRTSGRVIAAGIDVTSFYASLPKFYEVYSAEFLPDYYYRAYIALLALDADRTDWDLIRDITLSAASNLVLLHLEIGG